MDAAGQQAELRQQAVETYKETADEVKRGLELLEELAVAEMYDLAILVAARIRVLSKDIELCAKLAQTIK